MPSSFTLNNGIELIDTGEQSGEWGNTTNDNLSFIDTALDGQVTITAPGVGSGGSPNDLPITNGTASNGRNRLVEIYSGTNLGGTVYYQLTPSDAEKIIYIRNNLNTQDLIVFQGTYNASNDYLIPNGKTAVIFFNGTGSGAVAANVFNNAHFDALNIVGNAVVGGTLDVTGVATATTFEPDGDTAAGDNAAIGYTAAEGLILTGQGSTNDVTIKNDADADVLEIPTGTTNVTIVGNLGVGGTVTGTGTSVFASLDISGDIDVDGTTNLDVVDIDGAVDMASTLQVDGAITSSSGATITTGDNTAQLTLISTDADANDGPLLVLNRNSSSPADNDKVGQIQFLGEDDASNSTIFGSIVNQIKDASNGSEDGRMSFNIISDGSDRTFLNLTHDGTQAEVVVNEDSRDIDFRVESDSLANALFVNGEHGVIGMGIQNATAANNLHILGNNTTPSAHILLQSDDTASATSKISMYARDSSNVNKVAFIENSAGDLKLDTTGDIELNADGGDWLFNDGSVTLGSIQNDGSDNIIFMSNTNDKDIKFLGIDNSSTVTALLLDMSEAGAATFNNAVMASGTLSAHQTNKGVLEYTSNLTKIRSYGASSGTGQIQFLTGGGGGSADSLAMTINNDQQIGLGTSEPRHILDIEADTTGAIPTNADMGASNENDNYFSFHNASNSATFSGFALETRTSGASKWLIANEWQSTYLGDLVFRVRDGGTSSSEAMRITSAGNLELIQSNNLYWKHQGGGTIRAGITADSSDNLTFSTGSSDSTAMTIDGSGRVGIGSAPNSGWRNDIADQIVLMLGTEATLFSDAGVTTALINNAKINNGDAFVNISTRGASQYFQYEGAHKWYTAASASAGSNINTEMTTPKMTLDVSGNLLVGKTAAGIANTGSEFSSTGRAFFTFDGGGPLQLNRKTSDGDIIELHKDGTEVGSIGVSGNDFYVTGSVTNIAGTYFANSKIMPMKSGATSDSTIDLGTSSKRFKNLYLSGGVVFDAVAGNATSNTLDDYEEGTWTPVLKFDGATTGITYSNQVGIYTKVGRLVHLKLRIKLTSKGSASGEATITGMPFNPVDDFAGVSFEKGGSVDVWHDFNTASNYRYVATEAGGIELQKIDTNAVSSFADRVDNTDMLNTSDLRITITYNTA